MIKRWLAQLSRREKYLLSTATALVVFFLFYLCCWSPLTAATDRLVGQVQYNQRLLAWTKKAGAEFKSLPAVGGQTQPLSLGLIHGALSDSGLGSQSFTLMQRDSNHFVLTIGHANFDRLIAALVNLQQAAAFALTAMRLHQVDQGVVDGTIRLSS